MAKTTRAIVIGGSMNGLMAARVLSERFDKVTIIERDDLKQDNQPRNGAPQAKHLYFLLVRGQEIMTELFPDLETCLSSNGAQDVHWGLDTLSVIPSGHVKRFESGIISKFVSRTGLETTIRELVGAIPNVSTETCTQATRLIEESGVITGVETLHRKTKTRQVLHADLFVDASGRNTNTPDWLEELGYDRPETTEVNAHIGYASQWFEVPDSYRPDYKSIVLLHNPSTGNKRSGGLFFLEDNKVIVTLQSFNKDYPPVDEAGFLAFAKTLEAPHIYDFVKNAKPITPIYGYQREGSRLCHYERVEHHPENFIVMGDAFCSLNPVYGQGMTTGAMQVIALRDCLKRFSTKHLEGFGRAFYQMAHHVVLPAWTNAAAEDLRHPETQGERGGLAMRIAQIYVSWLYDTAAHDVVLATAFFKIYNLKLYGLAVLHPEILARLVWHKFIKPKPRRELESTLQFELKADPVHA